MRRVLYLYPKRWRDRYGDEMDQLLDDAPLTVRAAADIAVHAASVRLLDRTTLATVSALVAAAALLPLMVLGALWVNFVLLPSPIDPGILLAVLHVQPSSLLSLLGFVFAVVPMLQRVRNSDGRSTLRVRWRSYPVHAVLASVATVGVAMTVQQLYNEVWHGVAAWYWALCATSCEEPWMAPVTLAGIVYPWILVVPAGWLAWRRARRSRTVDRQPRSSRR